MTTPFDDPQSELAWMFLQNLSGDGDLDEGFELLSDEFTFWSNSTQQSRGKAEFRQLVEQITSKVDLDFDMIGCLNEGENVMIEVQPDGVTAAGIRYDSPIAFIFETHEGYITALREYSDTRLDEEALGISPGSP